MTLSNVSVLLPLLLAPVGDEAVSLALDPGSPLELEAEWGPLTDTVYKFEQRDPRLADPEVATPRRTWDAADFRVFLPEDPVEVGSVWALPADGALPFLRQLHPGATDALHHGRAQGRRLSNSVTAEGSAACLLAAGPRYAEVLLRIHADFRLDEAEPAAWFTPAQFEGHLLIDRKARSVVAFELSVPDQSSNVDINLRSEHGIIADIGRVAPMAVRGGTRPTIDAREQIELEEGRRLLARHFYPLAQLEWLPLNEALRVSRATDRPMHVVVLFGSLLDESC